MEKGTILKHADDIEPVCRYNDVVDELRTIFVRKNADYGDSFEKSLDKFGLVASAVRISDKMNRFANLITNDNINVKDESIEDTIRDLANYAIMTIMYIEKNKT